MKQDLASALRHGIMRIALFGSVAFHTDRPAFSQSRPLVNRASDTVFDLGPECFKSGPYNKSDQSSECLIQGQARVYLRSHPPRPPHSRQEHEEIDCRQPPQNTRRRGVLVGQEFINSLSEVHPGLTDKCFWVPSVEATLFNSRRLIKVLKAKKVYPLAELPKLGCSEVWSACRGISDNH
jgi:hypothetical protein